MFLIIDNYDSFVYNLARYFEELDEEVIVCKNDAITLSEIEAMSLDGLVISPGPKTPKEAGITLLTIERFHNKLPILGVCLGCQAIAQAFGGVIVKAPQPAHGVLSPVFHNSDRLFDGVNNPFTVTRYHSLIVERETLPDCLTVTCETDGGVIMGLRHKEFPIMGVQFHPEAELTESGHTILKNFIQDAGGNG